MPSSSAGQYCPHFTLPRSTTLYIIQTADNEKQLYSILYRNFCSLLMLCSGLGQLLFCFRSLHFPNIMHCLGMWLIQIGRQALKPALSRVLEEISLTNALHLAQNIIDNLITFDMGLHEAGDAAQNQPFWTLLASFCSHSGACSYCIRVCAGCDSDMIFKKRLTSVLFDCAYH